MKNFKEYLIGKGHSAKSAKKMQDDVNRFTAWREAENIPEGQESYADLLAYVKYCSEKGNSRNTISKYINTLEHYYNYQIKEEKRTDNPARSIQIKGIKKRILHDILSTKELEALYRNHPAQGLKGKRNKALLGLLIYQGLRSEELALLEPAYLKLREGKIYIPGGRKTNERTLKLESHQIAELMEYLYETRKEILALTGKESNKLFTSIGKGTHFNNIMQGLIQDLRKQNPAVKDIKQIRASVITGWLKSHNLRKVQYMAGHRYVSSTEKYRLNDMESLQEELNKYHPISH